MMFCFLKKSPKIHNKTKSVLNIEPMNIFLCNLIMYEIISGYLYKY